MPTGKPPGHAQRHALHSACATITPSPPREGEGEGGGGGIQKAADLWSLEQNEDDLHNMQ